MNTLIQNISGVLAAVGLTATGMAGVDARYVDTAEASDEYQTRDSANAERASQVAINTMVAATLLDLRMQQYRFVADNTKSEAERDHAEQQVAVSKTELEKLAKTYEKHLALFPVVSMGIALPGGSG